MQGGLRGLEVVLRKLDAVKLIFSHATALCCMYGTLRASANILHMYISLRQRSLACGWPRTLHPPPLVRDPTRGLGRLGLVSLLRCTVLRIIGLLALET